MYYCYYYHHHHSFQTSPSRPCPPSRRRRSPGFALDLEGARLPTLHLDVVVLHLLELEVLGALALPAKELLEERRLHAVDHRTGILYV